MSELKVCVLSTISIAKCQRQTKATVAGNGLITGDSNTKEYISNGGICGQPGRSDLCGT